MTVGAMTQGDTLAIYARKDDSVVVAFDRDVVTGWDDWKPVAIIELLSPAALELRDFELDDSGERLSLPVGFRYHLVRLEESRWSAYQVMDGQASAAVRLLYWREW